MPLRETIYHHDLPTDALFVFDPGIDDTVQNVRDEVGRSNGEGDYEGRSLQSREVLLLNPIKQPFPHPKPAKYQYNNYVNTKKQTKGNSTTSYVIQECILT